eukprot:comp6801_c0_seq1/m.2546 comp6801_c0_seq1/g.2546  ORF comp6801_c0_seq1/g.2546 comp6801_c0_seq1/m.2546 type:complete len:448 (-) comp6801_c0_seq1:205-1548(-)
MGPKEQEPKWQAQQRRSFSRWVDSQLEQIGASELIREDLLEKRFQDGLTLPRLLESLSGKKILRNQRQLAPKGPAGRADNIFLCMDLIKNEGIKLVGVGATDVIQGYTKMVLALVWSLIKHYNFGGETNSTGSKTTSASPLKTQPSGEVTNAGPSSVDVAPAAETCAVDTPSPQRSNDPLLAWVNEVLKTQAHSPIGNFTKDVQDGHVFVVLENHLNAKYGLPPLDPTATTEDVLAQASFVHKIPRLIDVEDLADPDEKSVMLYVSCFKKCAEAPLPPPKEVAASDATVEAVGVSEEAPKEVKLDPETTAVVYVRKPTVPGQHVYMVPLPPTTLTGPRRREVAVGGMQHLALSLDWTCAPDTDWYPEASTYESHGYGFDKQNLWGDHCWKLTASVAGLSGKTEFSFYAVLTQEPRGEVVEVSLPLKAKVGHISVVDFNGGSASYHIL